jgi:hypothetical protein
VAAGSKLSTAESVDQNRRTQRHRPAAAPCPFLGTKVLHIQCSKDWIATRDTLTNEKDKLEIEGLLYEPSRRQWERRENEQPAANAVEAKRLEANLACACVSRTGRRPAPVK